MPKAYESRLLSLICVVFSFMVPAPSFGQEPDFFDQDLGSIDAGNIYGQVRARNKTILSSEFAAKIIEIPFRDGNTFTEGENLIRFDCQLLQAQREKILATLDGNTKQLRAEQRLINLNSGSKVDVDLAASKVAEARADLKATDIKIEKCDLVAPYDGRVVQSFIGLHQFVQTGQQLLEIVEEAKPELEFIIPSNLVNEFEIGKKVQFKVSETGISYEVLIERRGAIIDPISRSLTMIGSFVAPDINLMIGMSGRVALGDE